MRRPALVLIVVCLVPASAAAGSSVGDRLEEAKEAKADALAVVRQAGERLHQLQQEYLEAEAEADEAAAALLDSLLRERELRGQLAQAQDVVDERADAAYRAGPGIFMNALLEAQSFGELVAASELIEHALIFDVERAAETLQSTEAASDVRHDLEEARTGLRGRAERLAELLAEMRTVLAQAQEAAREAGLRVEGLERQQRRLEQAEERNQQRLGLLEGLDQSELLAMLGPNGGRGCTIPPRLERTGDTFSGLASWYGDKFTGQTTAMGAIFDPDLFTAAHRTLPLPSFVHVKYQGKCATVLVNDRGPYIEERVLDLSEGAATYLGLAGAGVGPITAEVLVPTS
jgi:rare lipoprotein A (peptidoglycan hydrolase)